MFVLPPFDSPRLCQHCLPVFCSSSSVPLPSLSSPSQSVIVKSVERNAVNMYEARKFLLGLESNGVSSSAGPAVLSPAPNGPSPSLICPVGLDILASAGLGLSSLGNGSTRPAVVSTIYPCLSVRARCKQSSVGVLHRKACLREPKPKNLPSVNHQNGN